MKIDYDKQNHLWQIWTSNAPAKLLAKVKKVRMLVPSSLVVFDGPHGYLVVKGDLAIDDNQIATITKEKTA